MTQRNLIISVLGTIALVTALFALSGCDTVRYTLEGHAYTLQNGAKVPASRAKIILRCPKVLPSNKETMANNEGFYILRGEGVLQDCSLSAEYPDGKTSLLIDAKDIADQTYPFSPIYKKELVIERRDSIN